MASIFSKIIAGDVPAKMLWEDELCVAFLDVRPIADGHTLVVPRVEVDQWTDLPATTAAHLTTVSHSIGRAQRVVFDPARIGLMIAGFEVPHTHIHVIPMRSMADISFANAKANPDPDALHDQQQRLRVALSEAGHDAEVSRR